jgi:drug/metabolite transporter (DMT)-like permease
MSEKSFSQPAIIFIMATIACLLWGSAFPAIKISYDMLGIGDGSAMVKLQFAGYRFFLAGLYLLLFVLYQKRSLGIPTGAFKKLFVLGLIQTALQYLFFYVGLSNTTGIKGSIIISLGAFFSIILPHFYYHDDKLSQRKWAGLIIGFAGVVYINLAKGPLTGGFKVTGEGFMMLSAFMGSVASIYAKELSNKMDTLVMTCYQMLLGASVMIIMSTVSLGGNVIPMRIEILPLFMHLALISSAGFGMWFVLLNHNPISKVSIYKFQVPIWGTLLSAMFIPGESVTSAVVIGLVCVSAGIFLVNSGQNKKLAVSATSAR